MASTITDAVFLVPGFLGFDRFDAYLYFADRVRVALRSVLEARQERMVHVDAVPIPPSAPLARRQSMLIATLLARLARLEGEQRAPVRRVHLVGHSTGGLDSHLLTMAEPLGSGPWPDGFRALQERLHGLISIAAPYHGTCAAEQPLVEALSARGLPELAARLPEILRWLLPRIGPVTKNLLEDPETREVLKDLRSPAGQGFLLALVRSRGLVQELAPRRMEALHARLVPADGPWRRKSFVTVAGATPTADVPAQERARWLRRRETGASPPDAPSRPAGALFLALSELTAGRGAGCADQADGVVGAALTRLNGEIQRANDGPDRIVAADPALLPARIDASTNDGIVNTARQMFDPGDPEELEAVVVADHYDVVGHYDRTLWVYDRTGGETSREVVTGLLHSASRFRDDQFLELYRRVAQAIPLAP